VRQLRQTPILLVAAALASSAHAEPPGEKAFAVASPASVTFEVNVCIASAPDGEVDPECRTMQSQLPVRFGTLKVQKRHIVSVGFGEPGGIVLPTGSTVEIRPISIVEHQRLSTTGVIRTNELHLQLEMPGMVNTRLRLQRGRSVILAGQKYSDGYLIIEVKPTIPTPEPIVVEGGPRLPTPAPDAQTVGAPR
jgi:hypothetical protein